MNRPWAARYLISLFAAMGVMWSGAQLSSPSVIAVTAGRATSPAPTATLRVGIWTLWHDREVTLSPAAPDGHTLLQSCRRCSADVLRGPARIVAQHDAVTLTLEGRTVHLDGVWLTGAVKLMAHGQSVTTHNPLAISARAGVLVIVVKMPVESYVERVVSSESGEEDSAESLKALAIVVRSYALHEAHGHADYDLCDSTHCQLLHWQVSGSRMAEAHRATLATAGETLWFHTQRALAYFGKDCGGRTATPDEIWPRANPVPYLPSQLDRFCQVHGGREWASQIGRADLAASLAAHGLVAPGWQNLTVARRGVSGRAVTLRIDEREVNAEEFRLAVGESLGWNRIPSTWFEVSRMGDLFEFHGRGWGNGIGLCQKGAASMSQQGRAAQQILGQYFPGTRIADEATGHEWETFSGNGFVLESLDADDAAYLPVLNRARAEAAERAGLNAASPFTVRAFSSTPAFREATLAPGWVAAFTEGDWIGTQPLRTLASRRLLDPTMTHEFLHALVEQQANHLAPLWLREGLVEVWSENSDRRNTEMRPTIDIDAVDAALAHAGSEVESTAAHRAAEWYAAQLLTRYGRVQVLEWLRSGVPANIAAALRQR